MSRAVAVALARRAGARSLRAPASQGSSLHVGLAGARPPAARASSLGYFGRLRAPRPEQALKTGATVFFALVRGVRSLPEGRSLHVALARRAGARSLRAPASRGSSLGSLRRLLAMRKFGRRLEGA